MVQLSGIADYLGDRQAVGVGVPQTVAQTMASPQTIGEAARNGVKDFLNANQQSGGGGGGGVNPGDFDPNALSGGVTTYGVNPGYSPTGTGTLAGMFTGGLGNVAVGAYDGYVGAKTALDNLDLRGQTLGYTPGTWDKIGAGLGGFFSGAVGFGPDRTIGSYTGDFTGDDWSGSMGIGQPDYSVDPEYSAAMSFDTPAAAQGAPGEASASSDWSWGGSEYGGGAYGSYGEGSGHGPGDE